MNAPIHNKPGRYGYTHDRCRCSECRAAWAKYTRKQRANRRAQRVPIDGFLVAPVPPEAHGTESTYSNWGCQCERCKAAHATYVRRWLHRRTKSPAMGDS